MLCLNRGDTLKAWPASFPGNLHCAGDLARSQQAALKLAKDRDNNEYCREVRKCADEASRTPARLPTIGYGAVTTFPSSAIHMVGNLSESRKLIL